MKTEAVKLKNGIMNTLKLDNIIYASICGDFTDDDTATVSDHMEGFFNEVNGPTIRIWDFSNMSPDQYKLTPYGINNLNNWADKIKIKWASNTAYVIGSTDFIYGMSRMYEIKVSDDRMPVNVIKSFDELPDKIKKLIYESK